MNLISLPLFRSNNTEDLEAKDAYDVTDTRPINKIYESAKSGIKGLSEKLGGPRNVADSLARLVQMKNAGADSRQLLESSLGMFGTSTGALLKTAGSGILDKAAGFIDLDPSIVDKIKVGGQFVVDAVQSGNIRHYGDVHYLTGLIGNMAGEDGIMEYINIGVESAVWAASLTGAASLNLFDIYDDVRSSTDPDVYYQAVVFSLPTVASGGSIKGLDAMIRAVGVEGIIVNQPDFIYQFISSYTIPSDNTKTVSELGDELVQKLNTIDPRWCTYLLNGNEIYDFKNLTTPSRDAVRVLEVHPTMGPVIQLAPGYPETTVADIISEQFPLMVL